MMLKLIIFAFHFLTIAGVHSNTNIENQVHKTSVNSRWHYTFVTTQKLPWIDAFQACKRLKASLASVDSPEELEYLRKVVNEIGTPGNLTWMDSYWVSGADIYEEGKWVWMTSGQAIPKNSSLSLWASPQPDNAGGTQHCTCLWPLENWSLDDNTCSRSFNYICKRSVIDGCY